MHIFLILALAIGATAAIADDAAPCEFDLGGITYRVPRLTPGEVIRGPRDSRPNVALTDHPQITSIGERFTMDGLTRAYQPLPAVTVRERERFSQITTPGGVAVLDLPIKFPGQDYALPAEVAQFTDVIQQIIAFEHAANPRVGPDYYAYLTIHQSRVEPGFTQRRPGWQVDGFQGDERVPREEIDHSYVVSDTLPEVFTTQRFHFGEFDSARHHVFSELDRQALPQFERPGDSYQVYLINAYTPHRAQYATRPGWRTFVRITYSRAQFTKRGSALNPMLPYSWPYRAKNLRPDLKKYVPAARTETLSATLSLKKIPGARIGLVALGDADARVAALVGEMLKDAGRDVAFVASVRTPIAFTGGSIEDDDVIRIDDTFDPLNPLPEVSFAQLTPTYLVMPRGLPLHAPEDLKDIFSNLRNTHDVDSLVFIDVGGRALSSQFAQTQLLREHRLLSAVFQQDRTAVPYRTLVIVAPGYGLPPHSSSALFQVAHRYQPNPGDRQRVTALAESWPKRDPRAFADEIPSRIWLQALREEFGPQRFEPVNPADPLIEVKPEHQDLVIMPLDIAHVLTMMSVRDLK